MTKEKVELRNAQKKKKPAFIKQDAHKKKKLSPEWRRPKGLQSKVRLQLRGYRRRPKQGWRSPKDVRGFTHDGYEPVVVHAVAELLQTSKEKGIIIGSSVGLKKKILIVETALKENYILVNIDGSAFLESVKIQLKLRKEKKEKVAAEKKKKKKEKEKEVAEKAKEEEKKKEEGLEGIVTPEEKAKKESTKKEDPKTEKKEPAKKAKEPAKKEKPEKKTEKKEDPSADEKKKEYDKLLTKRSAQ